MSKDRPNRAYATQLANNAIGAKRPLAWFESFYAEAGGDAGFIPWADMAPNPNLVEWIEARETQGDCLRKILVVGCGLGDDAAYLAKSGSSVTAFDISVTAVDWARERFDGCGYNLHFRSENLLELPPEFQNAYDFVVEIYTLQVLPETVRDRALAALAQCLSSGGELLILCRGRDDGEAMNELPWGVSKSELKYLESVGLKQVAFEDYLDSHTGSRRFRAIFTRE